MLIYSLRRLLEAIPVLLGVTVLTFLILHLAPGDPAQLIGGPTATAQEIANIRQRLHLDQPLYAQYGTFLWDLVHGDLGQSVQRRESVLSMLAVRLPNTAVLAVTSMLVTLIGIPLGVMAATRPNSLLDLALMNVSLLGVSIPNFWLGILLIIWFSVGLGWFPVAGYHHPFLSLEGLKSLVLPAITLGTGGLARAYGGTANEALRTAESAPIVPKVRLRLILPFEFVDAAHHALSEFEGEKLDEDYDPDGVTLIVTVPKGSRETFATHLRDLTKGNVRVARI